MIICPHCGAFNSDSNKWCENCGQELIAEPPEEESAPVNTAAEEKSAAASGFMGSMGNTRYVSGHEDEDAGDMHKHVSGFGLFGSVGDTVYEAPAEEGEEVSGSGEKRGSLLGSVGDTKYTLNRPSDMESTDHSDSKLYGSVGSAKYRDASTLSPPSHGENHTSGLIGRVGDTVYRNADNNSKDGSSKDRTVFTDGLAGKMGKTHYTGKEKPYTPNGKRIPTKKRFFLKPPKGHKGTWIAAIGIITVITIIIWNIMPTSSILKDDTNSERDEILRELIALSATLSEETESAEDYYTQKSTVLETIDASASSEILTEAEAISLLHDRGFNQYPVKYSYSLDGIYRGETVAEETSNNRHPTYQTNYLSDTGILWTIHIVSGQIFASPVLLSLDDPFGKPILFSESSTLISYDNTTNKFFMTIPHEDTAIVRVVAKIDNTTLNNLTGEGLATS